MAWLLGNSCYIAHDCIRIHFHNRLNLFKNTIFRVRVDNSFNIIIFIIKKILCLNILLLKLS